MIEMLMLWNLIENLVVRLKQGMRFIILNISSSHWDNFVDELYLHNPTKVTLGLVLNNSDHNLLTKMQLLGLIMEIM